MDLSYIINELGEEREQYFNAMSPPIMQTSNFVFRKVDDLSAAFADEMGGYLYSRGLNPTVDILRKKLAALDGAEDCLVLNSGAAAIFASVFANIKAGDHIVSVRKPYTWAERLFSVVLPRFNVETTYVDGGSVEQYADALRPDTRLIYLESPNSWNYAIQDLKAIADLARSKGIVTIVDNSYCTPLYQRPIELGIDLSIQSATKYIGGHSDTVAGVISGSAAMIRKIFESEYLTIGSGIQPFNAWLLIRGLRTLPMRLKQVSETTRLVLAYLRQHPKVESCLFPLDPEFSDYELAKKQMSGACGLLTFIYRTEHRGEIIRFCEALRHIFMAVSWGGHESLIIPKCAGIRPEHFRPEKKEHRMLRLYIGQESADYLIADLEQAFLSASGG
ncbi:aminotransferase class I/II-fold pyridoxal phosphate-dependent enzyme [Flavihumibacter sp. RY-1]|uniref:Aminotransferase class I/II-fold pyridoxal phosphate-dependent enzyme n=1 Tax=Flavihumibacter fluminis TaxID=2909236 RepID=A0ABS9BL39_9BACT|nr:aminotransferase class I/II-fold pyridoxal phosphate-dependent enzyme [Flavihumibacter fluminis]MCF1716300.1 aminotransferase class I/II-fold pyridoxal phosphate-dependent enzyme [Flavihumibacter fluminis]